MKKELKRFCYQNPCPKCGQKDATVKWQSLMIIPFSREDLGEHIERCCTRCGYVWRELPLDADAPEQDAQP